MARRNATSTDWIRDEPSMQRPVLRPDPTYRVHLQNWYAGLKWHWHEWLGAQMDVRFQLVETKEEVIAAAEHQAPRASEPGGGGGGEHGGSV